ncbi:MAG: lipopolysaccharide biosynthesis protein [Cyanobacteria bacterium P01_F01_bin.56]
MSIERKAAKGVLWSVVEGWGSQAISLIIFFLLVRLLSPEVFGLLAMANVFWAFMNVFLDQGFAQALIQCRKLEPEHLDTAFWTNFFIGAVLASVTIASADFVANGFNQPQLAPILKCFSTLFIITSLSNVQKALLEREFAFKAIASRSLLGLFTSGIVGIAMALSGYGVWSLVGQRLTNEVVGSLVLWKASHWRPGFRFSKSHFNQLFNFGISLLALNFIGFFNNRGNDLLIGYYLGPVPLGYYAIARRVIDTLLQLLVRTTSQVALPTFSRLQDDLDQFRKVYYTATQLTSLIAFPIFLGVAVLAPEIIALVSGPQWQASVPIIQILTFSGIVQSMSFLKGPILMAMGKPEWRLWQSLLSITLNIIGFLIAFKWGIIAVTIAYVIRRCLVFPIGQWAIHLVIHFSWQTYLKQLVTPIISALSMAISMLILRGMIVNWFDSEILTIMACSILGSIIYLVMIKLLSPQLFQILLELLEKSVQKISSRRLAAK